MYVISKANKVKYTYLKDQPIIEQIPIRVDDSYFWTDDVNEAHRFEDLESAETVKELLEKQQVIPAEYRHLIFVPALYIEKITLL